MHIALGFAFTIAPHHHNHHTLRALCKCAAAFFTASTSPSTPPPPENHTTTSKPIFIVRRGHTCISEHWASTCGRTHTHTRHPNPLSGAHSSHTCIWRAHINTIFFSLNYFIRIACPTASAAAATAMRLVVVMNSNSAQRDREIKRHALFTESHHRIAAAAATPYQSHITSQQAFSADAPHRSPLAGLHFNLHHIYIRTSINVYTKNIYSYIVWCRIHTQPTHHLLPPSIQLAITPFWHGLLAYVL